MERKKIENPPLKEIEGEILEIKKLPEGVIGVKFIKTKKQKWAWPNEENNEGQFFMSPEDFRKINFRGVLAPGMRIILKTNEEDQIQEIRRILH